VYIVRVSKRTSPYYHYVCFIQAAVSNACIEGIWRTGYVAAFILKLGTRWL